MSALLTYIENLNRYRSFFNRPAIDFGNLTQEALNDLVDAMDSDMSPENLYCDGEISADVARRKADLIRSAYNELTNVAYERYLQLPQTYSF